MKQFNKELFDQTDLVARNAAKKLLVDSMYELVDNDDQHGVDLLLFKNGKHVGYVEVEIKFNWKAKAKWDFPNVNFLRRKEKYCVLDKPTLFLIFNRDLSQYLSVTSKAVMESPLEEVKNKYNQSGEFFRKVQMYNVIINKIYASVESILPKRQVSLDNDNYQYDNE